jgi:hypothetical protein
MSMTVASLLALALALVNKVAGSGLLSRLAQQRDLRADPAAGADLPGAGHHLPAASATPTEGGAMGAVGALIMALARAAQLSMELLTQALDNTARLSMLRAVHPGRLDGLQLHLPARSTAASGWSTCSTACPAAQLGFLIVVNVLVFILGCFIDFFEIAFIVIPLLAPVADKILPDVPGTPGIDHDLVRRAASAMNLQTSFLHAALRLRAVLPAQRGAPRTDYKDRVTGETHPGGAPRPQIYKGSIAFIVLQLIMVARRSSLVAEAGHRRHRQGDEGGRGRGLEGARQHARRQRCQLPGERDQPECSGAGGRGARRRPAPPPRKDDPMKALLEAVKADASKEQLASAAGQQPRRGRRTAGPTSRERQGRRHGGASSCRRRGSRGRRLTSFWALHEVVEGGLGEAEPQVRVATGTWRSPRSTFFQFGFLAVSSRSTVPSPSLKAASITSFGKREQLAPCRHQALRAPAGLRPSYLACMSMWA